MTGPWAVLLALTNLEATGPIHFTAAETPSPTASEVRVGWDPETRTWGAFPSTPPGAAPAGAAALGGADLPFQPDVEFTLPRGGGVLMGRRALEWATVKRGTDGRYHFECAGEPAAPDAPAPTDR